MTDVLLFGTMADIGPAVRDDLVSNGLEVALVDFPQNTFRDYWGYGRTLGKAIAAYRPGMVMPIGDSLALAKIKETRSETFAGPVLAVDTEHNIALLDSKVRTYGLASQLGIKQPESFDTEHIPEGRQLIFKRDVSFGGSGVHRPRTTTSLLNMIDRQNGAPYLIEEYIEGEDLSVDCIRTRDGFRAECYVSESSYSQGPSQKRTVAACPEAVETARRILDALDYRGVCGMDFIRNAGGLYFLECNARFTGGIVTQTANGFDIPYLLYKAYL